MIDLKTEQSGETMATIFIFFWKKRLVYVIWLQRKHGSFRAKWSLEAFSPCSQRRYNGILSRCNEQISDLQARRQKS